MDDPDLVRGNQVLALVRPRLEDPDRIPDIADHTPVQGVVRDHAVITTAVIAADPVLLDVDDLDHLCQIAEDTSEIEKIHHLLVVLAFLV